jgi:TatD DNase family protein
MDTDELQQMLNLISQHKKSKGRVVAVGEIGLDPLYGKRRELRDLQVKVFTEMLHAAEKASLPVVIHSRLSAQRIMDILSSFNLGGVLFHWFSNPIELLPQMIERGYYVSEGPPAVFSAKTQEVIRHVPLTHLLTETDGPVRYFGPFKDKLTTPALIPQVVKSIAGTKRIKESDVADQVLENLINLFKIEKLRPVVSSLP